MIVLVENNTLFDDVFKNLENNAELYDFVHSLLIEGEVKHFTIHDPIIRAGVRYGFFRNTENKVSISNKIFELLMTDYFISKNLRSKKQVNGVSQLMRPAGRKWLVSSIKYLGASRFRRARRLGAP